MEGSGGGVRLSITSVEAFRLWRDTGDWMDLRDLEAQIRREAPQTEKMLRGIAFHEVLERPLACAFVDEFGGRGYRVGARDGSGDFVFPGDGIDRVLSLWPRTGSPEVKSTFEIDGITVVGVADALEGLTVYEAKCSEKIDVENYFDSFQWKALLKFYNATVAKYVLAQGRDSGGRCIVIDNVLPMTLYRYPQMDDDIRRLVNDCATFIEQRNLGEYVQDREAA
jgi:hypothetical protein